jgi:2-amino-4-hydroxy-6-hydroxymethyldihydropteridine diphosphokinase
LSGDVAVHDAYIGLGSNLDHPRRQIARALRALGRLPRTRLVAVSRNYATEPIGATGPQPDFVNAVARVATALSPRALLAALLAIERRQRRRREPGRRNAPRTIDLDLLLYGRRRVRVPHLVVPHPRMHERAFVLRPLADVAPTLVVPGRGASRLLRGAVSGQRARPTRGHRNT